MTSTQNVSTITSAQALFRTQGRDIKSSKKTRKPKKIMDVFFPKLFFIYSGCIGVCICHTDNGIFDSHARDKYDRSHSIGTCVPEEPSIQSLAQCSQAIYLLCDMILNSEGCRLAHMK